MDLEKPVVTKLALRGADLVLIGELEQKVNKVTRKFLFTDITPDNLNFIAWEINQVAKQLLGEHKFFNCEDRSEEHTSELQSRQYLVCRLLLEKKKTNQNTLST